VTYFKFATHPYTKMNLAQRLDDPRPKTLNVLGQTKFFLNVK